MPFDFLRRQFFERFFNRNQNQPAQPARPTPQPRGDTFDEQEDSLRPPAATPAPTMQPEWEAALNPTPATENANTPAQNEPSAADLETTQQDGPGRTNTPPAAAPAAPASLVQEARRRGLFPEFQKMWNAHPRNNGSSESVSSGTVNQNQGWDPDKYANTCAIRVSVMLNTLGGEHKITRAKAVSAGIKSNRVFYSAKTKWYYLLAASEIAQYVSHHQGKPSFTSPKSGRYPDGAAYGADFGTKMAPAIKGKQGFVFFDKIFGFSGTGHVDCFSDMTLSAASSWYPCQSLKLWYV